MVANYHGHQLDLTTLRNRYSVSLKGANLQELMTRIIIAHRPETIINAERIMQLHNGQLQDVTASYKAQFGINTEK